MLSGDRVSEVLDSSIDNVSIHNDNNKVSLRPANEETKSLKSNVSFSGLVDKDILTFFVVFVIILMSVGLGVSMCFTELTTEAKKIIQIVLAKTNL